MTLVRWNPARELASMEIDRLNHMLNDFYGGGRSWMPAVDIQETETEYMLKAELPEVRKEDVKVSVENGVLRVEGERKQETEEKGKKFHRVERSYGSFLRTFTVPPDAEESKVAADFKDGILRVHLPKTEKPRPKAIEVKVV